MDWALGEGRRRSTPGRRQSSGMRGRLPGKGARSSDAVELGRGQGMGSISRQVGLRDKLSSAEK